MKSRFGLLLMWVFLLVSCMKGQNERGALFGVADEDSFTTRRYEDGWLVGEGDADERWYFINYGDYKLYAYLGDATHGDLYHVGKHRASTDGEGKIIPLTLEDFDYVENAEADFHYEIITRMPKPEDNLADIKAELKRFLQQKYEHFELVSEGSDYIEYVADGNTYFHGLVLSKGLLAEDEAQSLTLRELVGYSSKEHYAQYREAYRQSFITNRNIMLYHAYKQGYLPPYSMDELNHFIASVDRDFDYEGGRMVENPPRDTTYPDAIPINYGDYDLLVFANNAVLDRIYYLEKFRTLMPYNDGSTAPGLLEDLDYIANDDLDFHYEIITRIPTVQKGLEALRQELIESLKAQHPDFKLLEEGLDFIEYSANGNIYFHGLVLSQGLLPDIDAGHLVLREMIGFSEAESYLKYKELYEQSFYHNKAIMQEVVEEKGYHLLE
ncbi:hypothetical protein [Entomospira culicis]|uniref:Uncharacterized protein n=1 Tax=Entomospira culicis TaxID=2719989 RepID=A0A968GG36_9SPIO|nr:hypothetical protein [Entomospira culicis]NIZ19665.1 hypothetical protein [Entomospira culicis]NIZ69879.1 hypothetical protein [Entomospira culicis]WDI36984.1 hypothetical protein PVA46_06605 [Entomospira culicis]WDI38613.1 hypothetical protein PVA47_06615 [Entomospira culicis]